MQRTSRNGRTKKFHGLAGLVVALVLASANLPAQTSYEKNSSAFYLVEPPQTVFTFSGATGDILTAERGTRLYVPPASFRYTDGRDENEAVSEDIVLRVTERIEILDFATMPPGMIFPDGAVLVPSGLVLLAAATEAGRPVQLAPERRLSILMPDVRAEGTDAGVAVYHSVDDSGWRRISEASVHRSGAQAAKDGEPPVRGVRGFEANALGAWMIGRPAGSPTTCLEGRVDRPAGSIGAGEGNRVYAVTVDGRGAFRTEFRGDRFRVEAFRDQQVKLVVLSESGFAGSSAEFLPANLPRNGSRQNGACRDAGVVRIAAVPEDARYDRTAFRDRLGFPEPLYGVAYPAPPADFSGTQGVWPPHGLTSGSDFFLLVIGIARIAAYAASGLK